MSRHVLVARMDSLGDVLLSGPAVRAVARGADRVTYLCGPRGAPAAKLLPGVDDLLVRRVEWIDPEPPPLVRPEIDEFVDLLTRLAPDQALILTSYHQDPLPLALLLKMAGVPVVAAVSRDYPGSLLDVRHQVDDEVHEVMRSLSLVSRLGYRLADQEPPSLSLCGVPDRLPVALPVPDEPFVVVHPGTSVPARAWHPAKMRALCQTLVAHGQAVVVTGSPSEAGLTSYVGSEAIDLGGATDVPTLAAVLARASAVVAGNTGPAHLAAAVGTPVVSLFAPTVPASRWHPWGVPHRLLGDQRIACAQCRARQCPEPGHPCIDDVPVEAVVEAVQSLCPMLEATA